MEKSGCQCSWVPIVRLLQAFKTLNKFEKDLKIIVFQEKEGKLSPINNGFERKRIF